MSSYRPEEGSLGTLGTLGSLGQHRRWTNNLPCRSDSLFCSGPRLLIVTNISTAVV